MGRDFMKNFCCAATMFLSLHALAWAQAGTASDDAKAAKDHADAVEQVLADFRKSWSEAKTLSAKSGTLRELAVGDVRDPKLVRALGKYLNATAGDPDFIIPAAAAENLALLKGDPVAAGLLAGALNSYKKSPRMQIALLSAMGKNGSATLAPLLLERVRDLAANPDLAVAAAVALGDMPVENALSALLREWSELSKKRYKETAFPAVSTALQHAAQRMTGTVCLTVADFELWWARYGHEYADAANVKK